MLVTLVWLLFVGFVGIEVYINLKFKKIGAFTEKHPSAGLFISIGLSLALTAMFPAAGLVVLIASVGSTVAIQPFYIVRNKIKHGSAELQAKYRQIKTGYDEFKATWAWFGKLIKWSVIIITSPLWGPVLIRRWVIKNRSESDIPEPAPELKLVA